MTSIKDYVFGVRNSQLTFNLVCNCVFHSGSFLSQVMYLRISLACFSHANWVLRMQIASGMQMWAPKGWRRRIGRRAQLFFVKIFTYSSIFCGLNMISPGAAFLVFIMLGVLWASWIRDLVVVVNFGKCSVIFFKYFFCFLLIFFSWYSHYSFWCMLFHLFNSFFFFKFQFWKFLLLSSSS